LGDELMIAPVYKQNAQGRYVYLPEEMMLIRMRSYENYETQILQKGHHYVDIALDELVFFIRKNKAIPFGDTAINTSEIDLSSLKLIGYTDCSYKLYSDNGYSPVPENSLNISVL
ncbi:MAG: alpha-glucosidase, partial [Huintestinicola sp.]